MTLSTPFARLRLAVRLLLASWLSLLIVPTGAAAETAGTAQERSAPDRTAEKRFDIPAGDAFSTLKRFSAQSGEQLIYKVEFLDGVKTAAVRGTFTPREALGRMLVRTQLAVTQDDKTGTLAITRSAGTASGSDSANGEPELASAAKKKSPSP